MGDNSGKGDDAASSNGREGHHKKPKRPECQECEAFQVMEDALDEQKELDRMKTHLLSNVSHELRTPLTTINGYVKFLLGEKPGALNQEQKRFLKIMSEEADRLSQLIEQILIFTSIEAKKLRILPGDVSFNDVVEDIAMRLSVKAKEKLITIETELPEDAMIIECDKFKMEQVLINLVDNAIKFTPNGGVIRIILKASREEPGNVSIHVVDSGIGVPLDKQEKIFERFYQGDSSLSRPYGGTGLGLAICKEIVKLHGGDISVKSPLPKDLLEKITCNPDDNVIGSAFKISMPIRRG